MVEVSRDGQRVYFTNSLYGAWDDQFYPDGVGAWMAKLDVAPGGGISFDERFFPRGTRGAGGAPTRCGCRAATRPATRTASRPSRSGQVLLEPLGRHQRPQCTTSWNGRRSGRASGTSGRSAG